MLDDATIAKAPKALLHDHLDGGLRPATVIDLAAEHGYDALPTTDVDDLAAWFRRGADRKSLELYLETFAHTFGVMQWPDAIARVAAECAEDLAADGVVYAEVRMAPELCTEQGLTLDEVVKANLEGFLDSDVIERGGDLVVPYPDHGVLNCASRCGNLETGLQTHRFAPRIGLPPASVPGSADIYDLQNIVKQVLPGTAPDGMAARAASQMIG